MMPGEDAARGAAGLPDRLAPFLFAALGWLIASSLVVYTHRRAGVWSFPLDDPWIHFTFARNLAEHGLYTFHPGGPAVSGSTSPLFVALAAAGFRLTSNEKLLGYALGVGFHGLFLVAFFRLAAGALADRRLAALATAWVALDARTNVLAASGMETSLFLLGITAVLGFWRAGNALATAAALGAAAWIRPEGLLLACVLAIDWLLSPRRIRRGLPALVLLALVLAAYFAFNRSLSGAFLPTTFSAKRAFYGEYSRARFLGRDVAGVFASGGMVLLVPFFLARAGAEAAAVLRRRPAVPVRAELGWAVALPLAYLVLLPFGHRFGRYLAPASPFVCLVGAAGLRAALGWAGPGRERVARTAAWIVCASVLAGQAALLQKGFRECALACRYTAERQEAAGRWLASHTPPEAVVATHDVGAISFHSGRRVVDIAGLMTPEVIPHLGKGDYLEYLSGLFERERVTHLALLVNWLEVGNQAPLAWLNREPEHMAIHEWRPGKTHLVPREATALDERAEARLAAGDAAGALAFIERSLALDPDHARTWLLAGRAWEGQGKREKALEAYGKAASLFPEDPAAREAQGRLGVDASRRGGWLRTDARDAGEAIRLLDERPVPAIPYLLAPAGAPATEGRILAPDHRPALEGISS